MKSRYNAAAPQVHGIEPLVPGHPHASTWSTAGSSTGRTSAQVHRVAILGDDMTDQLFGTRDSLGEEITLNGIRYTVVGKIRKKDQDSNYSGPDNDKIFVPFAAMAQGLSPPRRASPAPSRTSSWRRSSRSSTTCRGS